MKITTALWRELTSPTAHHLSLRDAAAIEIEVEGLPSRIGLVMELKHADLDQTFTLLAHAAPSVMRAVHDQLSIILETLDQGDHP